MGEWTPKSAKAVDEDWMPPSARIPVRAHSRQVKPRSPVADMALMGMGLGHPSVADAVHAIPAAGSIFGTSLGLGAGALFGGGPPGALIGESIGGGAGGAGGAALSHLAEDALGMEAPPSRGGDIALEGALGAAGPLVPAAARATGKVAMQAALRATPEVAQTAIREGITATGAGLQKLKGLMNTATRQTKRLATQATFNRVRYDQVQAALEPAKALVRLVTKDTPGGTAHLSRDAQQIGEWAQEFLNDHPKPLTPLQALAIKQTSDSKARGIHAALRADKYVPPGEQLYAQWHKAVADYMRDLLHGIPDPVTGQYHGGIPGFAEADARNSELIQLHERLAPVSNKGKSVVARALSRGAAPAGGAAVGAGLGAMQPGHRLQGAAEGALIGGALASPQALSMGGLGANNPIVQLLLRALTSGAQVGAAQP